VAVLDTVTGLWKKGPATFVACLAVAACGWLYRDLQKAEERTRNALQACLGRVEKKVDATAIAIGATVAAPGGEALQAPDKPLKLIRAAAPAPSAPAAPAAPPAPVVAPATSPSP